jgi:hypothetical protein
MDSNLKYLRDKIREMMNEFADYIATGSAIDWADYRHKVGVIEGLAKAERELLDLADKLKEQE